MATAVGTNALGIDANNFFTRGTAGQTDNVGKSMVQLHAEQMQLEKEKTALQKLSILLPQLGFFVRVVALRETNWDVDKALALLRRFVAENDLKLKALQKKRRKVQRELEKEQDEPSTSSSSDSGSASSDSGGEYGSDSEGGERKKRKRVEKDKKLKKRGKDKDKTKRSKGKVRDKAAAAARTLTHSEDFGKYGIIRESDAYAKRNEFILWALEVKKTDVENLGKFEERDLFKDYMEDYNTGTLPHRKYYDLEAYERARAAKAAAKGAKHAAKKKSALNDEEALRQQRAEERQRLAAERMVDAYREIKYSDKGQDMREQEMLRAQMALAYKTGDVSKAHRLLDRLQPDELKKK
ncbi:hypothetical protein VOLCADRAFT_120332 [Volvox carteri f. nagariensis]|uniref:Uncharacterized protein n=1 Tax=Volvox carteri f. nagariensis TaxID=3068 RepID=D8TKL3_VOLCA|nr:uncharacterized protein VOLCADRAFT_120332 [Volvox carteri f. nagariensis]EFJ51906.1 hypothetical protein VOLCADRAFT_120332 [Volvox carteri f. nagariensis]|eukprot:XP_002946680.1 hypothetical protein VOLCADRAFT_120332 [Volvox carteri f. nagariensis]